MTLAGGNAVKRMMDEVEKEDNIFYHDIAVAAKLAMKENVMEAMTMFSMK